MITIFFLYVRSVRIQTNIEHTGIGLYPHATVALQQLTHVHFCCTLEIKCYFYKYLNYHLAHQQQSLAKNT